MAALAVAVTAVAVHALGLLGWSWQVVAHRLAGVPLMLVAALLAGRASGQADLPGARRHWRLMAVTCVLVAVSYTVSLLAMVAGGVVRYPLHVPAAQVIDILAVLAAVAAVLSVPAAVAWSASRLRLGLDMATVLLGGVVFLWYFSVGPSIAAGMSAQQLATLLLAAGALVALFAVARVILAGAAGVDRSALILLGLAALTEVGVEAVGPLVTGQPRFHPALLLSAVFRALLIAAPLVQLRSGATGRRGRRRRQRPFSILPYLAAGGTYLLLVVSVSDQADGRTAGVLAGAITLTALVVARQVVALRDNARLVVRLDHSLAAVRRAVAREQAIAEVGTALLTTRQEAGVYRLAVDAAMRLLADQPAGRAALVVPADAGDNAWTVAAAAGDHAEAIAGARLAPGGDAEAIISRLAAGDIVSAQSLAGLCLSVPGVTDPDSRTVELLPLLANGRFFGILSAGSDEQLPAEIRKSLEALRTQVALALDSVALTTELTRRAMHDPLTGLGNRALLRDRLNQALARSRRGHGLVAALLLDLDGFKKVNDTLGHDAGDELLRTVADRLRGCVRTEDTIGRFGTPDTAADARDGAQVDQASASTATIGRLGGDEFVVVAEDLTDVAGAIVVAERVIAALDAPAAVAGQLVTTRASIGIALSSPDLLTPDDLLRRADAAMYLAKRAGAGGYAVSGQPTPRAGPLRYVAERPAQLERSD